MAVAGRCQGTAAPGTHTDGNWIVAGCRNKQLQVAVGRGQSETAACHNSQRVKDTAAVGCSGRRRDGAGRARAEAGLAGAAAGWGMRDGEVAASALVAAEGAPEAGTRRKREVGRSRMVLVADRRDAWHRRL